MTLYDQTQMTEIEHTTTVQRSVTSENWHMRWYPMVWKPTKINSSKQIAGFEAN